MQKLYHNRLALSIFSIVFLASIAFFGCSQQNNTDSNTPKSPPPQQPTLSERIRNEKGNYSVQFPSSSGIPTTYTKQIEVADMPAEVITMMTEDSLAAYIVSAVRYPDVVFQKQSQLNIITSAIEQFMEESNTYIAGKIQTLKNSNELIHQRIRFAGSEKPPHVGMMEIRLRKPYLYQTICVADDTSIIYSPLTRAFFQSFSVLK